MHLKSKYLVICYVVYLTNIGILLAALVDALGQFFPVVFAVVSVENDENWLWFLTNLRVAVVQPHAPQFLNNNLLNLLLDCQKRSH